jgi:hypothetical protein
MLLLLLLVVVDLDHGVPVLVDARDTSAAGDDSYAADIECLQHMVSDVRHLGIYCGTGMDWDMDTVVIENLDDVGWKDGAGVHFCAWCWFICCCCCCCCCWK